jgi:glycine/D-amino acid oxidase-like deaminating enzyme
MEYPGCRSHDMNMEQSYDHIVIGGGFYGCCIALYLQDCGRRVLILERGNDLLTRASYVNQARVHNGYHYPRSLITGMRSSANFPSFLRDFGYGVIKNFEKIYAIARNSKVTGNQFHQFCRGIGAPVREVSSDNLSMFNKDLIEAAFWVQEYAFNAVALRKGLRQRLEKAGVAIRTECEVERIEYKNSRLLATLCDGAIVSATGIFNCCYARINTLLHNSGLPMLPMKHEIAEVALVRPAKMVAKLGITVMDGPFFSSMPFPAAELHSFTHVRFTPHVSWLDSQEFKDPYNFLTAYSASSHFPLMLKDAVRYIPSLKDTLYVSSMYEVKTVLIQNEDNDGRPILYRPDFELPNFSVIMGGKIDNIYDIIHAMRHLRPEAENPLMLNPDAFFARLFDAAN